MWIPTTESLPKQQQVVLAVAGAGKSRRVAVLRACYPEPGVHDDDEFGWFDIEGRDWVLPVTHWSPLPSLPGVAAPAPAVERGVAEPLPTAFDYAAMRQMAVTKEWCRGWDDARAALTATTSPSDTELASHEEMGAVAMRDDGRLDADNWLPNGDVPAELDDGWRWVDAKRVLILSPTLTATGAAQGDGAMVEVCREDANNYCKIITALGMEEEGDPVAAVERLVAQQEAPAAQPMTDEQRRALWRASEFRGNGGQIDWFIEGTRAAERHYRIGIQPAATKGTT